MLNITAAEQLKAALKKGTETCFVSGGSLKIMHQGKEIFYHEEGLCDIENQSPVCRDSIFRLYSMTKPVTAAAAMILVERGEIDLYEPVSKYLPGFTNQKVSIGGTLVPAAREMNLHDLMDMTGGLVYGGPDQAGQDTEALFREIDQRLLGNNPMSTMEAMNRLGECALAFHPGSNWQYGTSADALGAVIEAASGMKFGAFLEKEIFAPLGMKDTGFWLPEEKRSRLVKTYANDGNGGLELYTGNHLGIINAMDRQPAFESGGAGLVSTIDDYSQFAAMLMGNGTLGNVQILRPRTVKYLRSATLNAAQHKGFDQWVTLAGHSYGNLMRVMTDNTRAADLGLNGEYGWDGWLGCYFCNCPAEELTILLMIQKKDAGTTPMTRKIRNIIFSSLA